MSTNTKTFTILKQQTRNGCIPTCAASVLRYHGVPKPDWSEQGLMAMYPGTGTSGFDKLKNYLDAQPELKGWDVVVEDAGTKTLKEFATDVVTKNGPALMPIQGPHCVVIVDPDDQGAVLCDPAPGRPDRKHHSWADIENIWIRSLLYFRKK